MTAPAVVYATLWLLIAAVVVAQIAAAVLPLLILIYLVPPAERPDLIVLLEQRAGLFHILRLHILRLRRAGRSRASSPPERGP